MQLNLDIPILVRQFQAPNGTQYNLQPLFTGYPSCTHFRFEKGINLLKKEITQVLRITRSNRQELARGPLWFAFHPKFEYIRFPFTGSVGKRFLKGTFGVVYFKMKGQHFLMFPTFEQKMVLLEKLPSGKVNRKEEIQRCLEIMLREKYKRDPDFEMEDLVAAKKEFTTTVSLSGVRLLPGQFGFEEQNQFNFFQFFQREIRFNGWSELEKVGFNYNDLYPNDLERAFFQDALVEQLSRLLYETTNTPLVLVGESGIGKHAVLQEVIFRHLEKWSAENPGLRQEAWHVDPTRIISGMSIVGMWEKRFEAILAHLSMKNLRSGKSSKMVVDNPVALLRIGKSGSNDLTLSHVLKPYLEKQRFQLILIASPDEWKLVQEKDRGFADLFQVIRLEPVRFEKALQIVLIQRRRLELEFDCEITVQAINQLFSLHRNFLSNQALPGGVMKPLKQLVSKYRGKTIDAPEVRMEFKASSGLIEEIFDETLPMEAPTIERQIRQQLIGQKAAAESLIQVIHLIKSKLANPRKPISSFLFIGPTGVGKTQAAKVLCHFLMGSDRHLMRFDMNEYNDGGAVSRLIGDYQRPEGILTGKVRYQPFGVLLLDEIEKAHPRVLDILLQVLDDGRLTDSRGQTVDFANTVIIMTSNLGAEEVASQVGYRTGGSSDDAIYQKAIRNHFRPEFLNRIEEVVIFKPLELEHVLSIARLQIRELLQRDGFVRRTTILNISQEALEWVATRGYDKRMGGRALKRQIEKDLTTLSAEQLISTHTDNPILLSILRENNRLTPHITPISFVQPLKEDWLPDLPDVEKGRNFYNQLLETTQSLEDTLETWEEKNALAPREPLVFDAPHSDKQPNWEYLNFKNQIQEVKEKLKTIALGFQDRYFREAPAIPFRLKSTAIFSKTYRSHRAERENLKDLLFQQDALREITHQYEFGSANFDSIKTEFLQYFLEVAFLHVMAKGVETGETAKLHFRFQSLITGLGENQIEHLSQQYQKVLEKLDIPFEVHPEDHSIQAEGYGLRELFAGEEGLHLFYVDQQNPLPVRLTIHALPDESEPNFQVVRIYEEHATLTDLRSGFSNAFHIHPSEFKLLLYAGLSPEVRRQITPF